MAGSSSPPSIKVKTGEAPSLHSNKSRAQDHTFRVIKSHPRSQMYSRAELNHLLHESLFKIRGSDRRHIITKVIWRRIHRVQTFIPRVANILINKSGSTRRRGNSVNQIILVVQQKNKRAT